MDRRKNVGKLLERDSVEEIYLEKQLCLFAKFKEVIRGFLKSRRTINISLHNISLL